MLFPRPSPPSGPQRASWQPKTWKRTGSASAFRWILLSVAVSVALAYGLFAFRIVLADHHNNQSLQSSAAAAAPKVPPIQPSPSHNKQNEHSCTFRNYPNHRYYNLNSLEQPDFLVGTKDSTVDYIYGAWPSLLPVVGAEKLCVDQSEWETSPAKTTWPFADGTNPSLLSAERYHEAGSMAKLPPHVQWLATACMTNSQCHWKDAAQDMQEFGISSQDKPTTVRTLLLLLDHNFQSVGQATLMLKLDAPYGGRGNRKRPLPPQPNLQTMALDDARLFVNAGQLWVSYREGRLYGYEAQVLNPVHLELRNNDNHPLQFSATLKASETTSFCCGRNMALMENRDQTTKSPSLLALTWVDPVTVVSVDTTPHSQEQQPLKQQRQRRLSVIPSQEEETAENYDHYHHRRLSAANKRKKKKSHIHGTNAFMVYLPDRGEFLGVAHFHRPNDRNANDYARFGHHYTHAFYTVQAKKNNIATPSSLEYDLKALSAEFVLPSQATGRQPQDDAEVIQFVSGLEWDAVHRQIVLAYGVNDCEGGVVRVDYDTTLKKWLRHVSPGKEVVDLMQPLDVTTMTRKRTTAG